MSQPPAGEPPLDGLYGLYSVAVECSHTISRLDVARKENPISYILRMPSPYQVADLSISFIYFFSSNEMEMTRERLKQPVVLETPPRRGAKHSTAWCNKLQAKADRRPVHALSRLKRERKYLLLITKGQLGPPRRSIGWILISYPLLFRIH